MNPNSLKAEPLKTLYYIALLRWVESGAKGNKWPAFDWLIKVGISSGVGGLQAQRTAYGRARR